MVGGCKSGHGGAISAPKDERVRHTTRGSRVVCQLYRAMSDAIRGRVGARQGSNHRGAALHVLLQHVIGRCTVCLCAVCPDHHQVCAKCQTIFCKDYPLSSETGRVLCEKCNKIVRSRDWLKTALVYCAYGGFVNWLLFGTVGCLFRFMERGNLDWDYGLGAYSSVGLVGLALGADFWHHVRF